MQNFLFTDFDEPGLLQMSAINSHSVNRETATDGIWQCIIIRSWVCFLLLLKFFTAFCSTTTVEVRIDGSSMEINS